METITEYQYNNRNNGYKKISYISEIIQKYEKILEENDYDFLQVKAWLLYEFEKIWISEGIIRLQELIKYQKGITQFKNENRHLDWKEQTGKLFQFRSDKFVNNITLNYHGIVLEINCYDMNDFLALKFANKNRNFTQEDRATWFFKIVDYRWFKVPVCVTLWEQGSESIMTHEKTHLRNSIIGMNYYSRGWGNDIYETVVLDDLQEEILAFFSEGMKRAEVQLNILHDKRYHFYKRIESWTDVERMRFINDCQKFINIARQIKELRPESFFVDLAIIPIKKWGIYLKYLLREKKRNAIE